MDPPESRVEPEGIRSEHPTCSEHHDANVEACVRLITFDADTAAAVEQLRRERGVGVSAAVNELLRRALVATAGSTAPFVQATSAGHARIDVTDTAATLELLDGTAAAG